jgi:hypothetical protein
MPEVRIKDWISPASSTWIYTFSQHFLDFDRIAAERSCSGLDAKTDQSLGENSIMDIN